MRARLHILWVSGRAVLSAALEELFDAQLEDFLTAEDVPREAFVALARSLSRAQAGYILPNAARVHASKHARTQ